MPDLQTALKSADCVVITTHHSAYDWDMVLRSSKLIVDTRNALGAKGKASAKVTRL